MSRPDGVPEWAWEEAAALRSAVNWQSNASNEAIARALLAAERRGIERAADAYRDGAGPEDGKWDHFLSAELAIRLLGEAE
jgi:hypothetical protein